VTSRPALAAEHRVVLGKKVAALRRAGKLPAVVYGHGRPSEAIQLEAHEFGLIRKHVGRNALLDLKVGTSRPVPVLLHAVHEHPVTRLPLHADFFMVKMTEEITVDVPVQLIGESAAVERHGGTLLHQHEAVHVRALPADLPSALELDISALDTFEATLHAGDLRLPRGVTLLTDPTELIARVAPPRVEISAAPRAETEEAAAAAAEAEASGESGSGS
jgi:large subunit ribosomal protein L25